MGYLDNSSVTVDAVLTKLGRERLANGDLDITKFALGDDEVDYSLYDTSHNLGSAYYGEAIEKMPVLEAFTNDTQTLKFRLVTLPKNTQVLPVVSVAQSSITLTTPGQKVTLNPMTENVTGGNASGYSFTIGNSDIVQISAVGTLQESPVMTRGTTGRQVSRRRRRRGGATGVSSSGPATGLKLAATVNGSSVTVTAYSLIETTTTTLTVTGIDSGGSVTIPITVNQDPALAT